MQKGARSRKTCEFHVFMMPEELMIEDNYEEERDGAEDDREAYGEDDDDESYGADADSDIMEWCPNCNDIKPHIQVGEGGVKIKCLECNLEHLRDDAQDAFPDPQPKEEEEDLSTEESRLAAWTRHTNVDETDMKPYSIRIKPAVGDVLKHAKFGVGVVVRLSDATRAEVLFRDGIRRLVCGK